MSSSEMPQSDMTIFFSSDMLATALSTPEVSLI